MTFRIAKNGWVIREGDPMGIEAEDCPDPGIGTNRMDQALCALYAGILIPGSLAVDVGANHGVHTIAMARCGALVMAIEPQHTVALQLSANVVLQGHAERVWIAEMALGANESPQTAVNADDDRTGYRMFAPAGMDLTPREFVPCMRLDSYLPRMRQFVPALRVPLRLVKIDTEGADCAVIMGALQTIEIERPTVIWEDQDNKYHPFSQAAHGTRASDIQEWFRRHGFELSRITEVDWMAKPA